MRYLIVGVSLLIMLRLEDASAADRSLFLEVEINGRDTHHIVNILDRDGAILAAPSDLESLGLIVTQADSAIGRQGDRWIPLGTISNLSYALDESTQTLRIVAIRGAISPTVLSFGGTDGAAGKFEVQSGTGVTLNYDLVGTHSTDTTIGSGVVSGRFFSPGGVFDTGVLGASSAQKEPLIRLNSTYTVSDPASLRSYKLGDFVTGALSWTRAVRFGGVQVSTDFSLRPDLITFPLPSVSGNASVPSTVDVLVDGVKRLSRQVDTGPFDIPQIPMVTGSGEVSVVVKDALGRQQVQTLPYYASNELLAPGLNAFSAEMGFVRRSYGVDSNDYRTLATSASFRHGVYPWLSVEVHGEGAADMGMSGIGVVSKLGEVGVVTVSGAASGGGGKAGAQYGAAFQHANRLLSFSGSIQIAEPGFVDLPSLNGDPISHLTATADIGTSLEDVGSIGIGFTAESGAAENARIVSATYSRRLFDAVSLSLTGYRDYASGGSTGALLSLSVAFGSRVSGNLSGSLSGGKSSATVDLSRSAVSVGDVGWQVADGGGSQSHRFGQLNYKSPWGEVGGGVDQLDGQTTTRLTADGALSFIDGEIFASNSIPDSFAIVDTDGQPNIAVTEENRFVDRTDSDGYLLIPELRSYESNRIGINPEDIPADAEAGDTSRLVLPQDRSGVVVRFPIRKSRGALLHLVDGQGDAIPLGSTATLSNSGETMTVGYDGKTFLRALDDSNVIQVTLPDGRSCRVSFSYHAIPGTIPTIGPLVCQTESQ